MAFVSRTQLSDLLGAFDNQRIHISDFLISVITHSAFQDHPSVDHLLTHTNDVLDVFLAHPKSSKPVLHWANSLIKTKYAEAIRNLARKENGWHFVPPRAAMEKLEEFRIEDMAREMKDLSPDLWDLIGLLLSADKQSAELESNPAEMDIDDDDLPTDPRSKAEKPAERREALIVIKKVVIISMMMQSTNQQSNMLESVIGIFLHASNTPSKVIETLARMGISISLDSIHNAVHSLSRETFNRLRTMGQTLLVGYAYDNFDIGVAVSAVIVMPLIFMAASCTTFCCPRIFNGLMTS
ncbi:hypothetical protein B0H13DRAFT_1667395 [Mycena leptocephala]|nr:hypothetical protein B0H13DRAFT_1667395 [Mycena leptocephala]